MSAIVSTLFGRFGDRYGTLIRSDRCSVKVGIKFIAAVGFGALLLRRPHACTAWPLARRRVFDA
jgi:hypothetical protein